MKNNILLIVIFVLVTSVFGSTMEQLYMHRLNNSSDYTKSLENFDKALKDYSEISQFFIPDVSFGLDYSTSSASETNSKKFDFDINFLEIYGITLGINIPFVINQKSENMIEMDNVNLKLSLNDIFSDEKSNNLNIEAVFLDSTFNLIKVKFDIFTELLNDISSYHYYSKNKEIAENNLNLLQIEMESENNEESINEIKSEILEQKKQILEYNKQIISIGFDDYYENLYNEFQVLIKEIAENGEPKVDLDERLDIRAQKLRVEAEELINETWYKPYLPEISVNFGINDFEDLSWNFGFQFLFDIFNREVSLEVEERKSNYEALKLNELVNGNENTYKVDLMELETSEISVEIAEISLKEYEEEMEKSKKLLDSGFINDIDYEIAVNNYEKSLLDYQREIENLYLAKLNLYIYSNTISEVNFFDIETTTKDDENE
ncbi:MAG: hypothetical protein PWQ77_555 [Kosmotogales bacterium]|nr:hypothetical protein [Kosmotogales bacterium]